MKKVLRETEAVGGYRAAGRLIIAMLLPSC